LYSEIGALLRRNDPARWTELLRRRSLEELPFDLDRVPRGAPIFLDTTVYIDELRGDLPFSVEFFLARSIVYHCAVARAELAVSLGTLDPEDPRTPKRRALLETAIDRMRPERRIAPSERAWTEAALLVGILRRTQGLDEVRTRSLLNDALMLMTAREHGATLLSRNVSDMDLLTVLRPDAKIVFYARANDPGAAETAG
jgi:predicted nucleic acid-binding protein